MYSLLTVDVDHRVREAAQLAHATLIKKVGKAIAVCLKQLAGPWFVSQYDMYPPAASAATNCFTVSFFYTSNCKHFNFIDKVYLYFQTTFPQQKFESAVIHCRKEILEYICDNITNLSPQSFATNKYVWKYYGFQFQHATSKWNSYSLIMIYSLAFVDL